jgi:hypothetical protein
MRAENTHASGK